MGSGHIIKFFFCLNTHVFNRVLVYAKLKYIHTYTLGCISPLKYLALELIIVVNAPCAHKS